MNRFTLALNHGSFLLVLLLLVGCAIPPKSAFQQVRVDKTALSNIKKIALLRVNEPGQIQITSYGGFGANVVAFVSGFVGIYVYNYTISKPTAEKRGKVFLKAKNENNVYFSAAMDAALQLELTKKGFEVIYIEDQSPMPSGDRKTDYYSQLQTDADAVLSVGLWSLGYTEWKSSGYTPNLIVYAELFNHASKKIIYSRQFYIGPAETSRLMEKIFPDEKYKYDSFDTLIKSFDVAAQGIIGCQNKIAARIAEHLK